ncbi:MAG: hypothetical protein SGI88_15185 [Candidatus Hydrogenedentes bacterium]|nr:hypothetical protein [Candidatus Hydrogenedentota bacterium]
MQADDRPIHFSTELLHTPRSHTLPALQKLYYELSQTRHANYLGTDFSPNAPPRFFTKRGKKTQSITAFLPDRILIAEEWVDIPLAGFLDRVETIADHAGRELGISTFAAQSVTIRTTFALSHFDDARSYLFDKMCGLEHKLGPHIGRPIGVGGLRLVLPETPEHPGALHVTIESYRFSRNEVFVEVKGVFARPIPTDSIVVLRDNTRVVRDFIGGNIYPYLAQFDVPVGDTL